MAPFPGPSAGASLKLRTARKVLVQLLAIPRPIGRGLIEAAPCPENGRKRRDQFPGPSAAYPIISRRISALGVFSTRARRFIISSVIGRPQVRLVFANPSLIRRSIKGHRRLHHALEHHPVLRGCVRRVLAMVRLQGFRIACDAIAVARWIDRLSLDERELTAFRFSRHPVRQGNTPIPMAGWLGALGLDGPLAPLAPWLSLAETCNTGSHAGLGMGWFDLAMA
jgi:hypothetical protein